MVDEEWDVISEPNDGAAEAETTEAVPEDGSTPVVLWQGLLGTVLGLLSLPLVAWGIMRLILGFVGKGAPVPFGLWAGGLGLTLLIETALGLRLRRVSEMCAVSFALAAFFSVLAAVGMMTELAPLLLPKGT